MADNFRFLKKKDILSLTSIRKYETKLGEVVECAKEEDFETSIASSKADYVIIGIPEQAGVLANYGKSGTQTLWPDFLKSFLNIQSNDFLSGKEIFIGGYFDFSEELKLINATAPNAEERIDALRTLVHKIDERVEEVVKIITRQKKIPILIGGGHNNAYGAIKGAAKGLHSVDAIPLAQISAINLDAHTDYRAHEGRHSGNAFRYADEDGYLNRYFVIGPHENYIQQYVAKDMAENPFLDYVTYEDIFIRERITFTQAISRATGFVEDNHTGIELDLDALENTLSSASTPCGITTLEARRFLHSVTSECKIAYLHVCEGAAEIEHETRNPLTGKLVSYLVTDFIKSHQQSNQQ